MQDLVEALRGPSVGATVGDQVECIRRASGEVLWGGVVTAVRRRGMLHVLSSKGRTFIFSSRGSPMGNLAHFHDWRLRRVEVHDDV